MHVAGLWRYPVKSLRGEPLLSANITSNGIAGDRLVHVRGANGPISGRSHHALLTIPASTNVDGTPLVAGYAWDSDEAARLLHAKAGGDARFIAYDGPERFDVLNLLVATDGAVARFGHDIRRLRPNILIGGVDADDEATWPGNALAIGDALIGVHSLRARCIVTTIDPDTGARDPSVFRKIVKEFDGELALNCWVIRPGIVRIDDAVELVATDAEPDDIGGWTVGAPYVVA